MKKCSFPRTDPILRSANGIKQVGIFALDLIGKAWNSPNTAIGLAWGATGLAIETLVAPFKLVAKTIGFRGKVFDYRIRIEKNSIQFHSHPLMLLGAISLGNTTHYGEIMAAGEPYTSSYTGALISDVAIHEQAHTYQSQVFGPLFIPVYFAMGGVSGTNPFEKMADNYALGGTWKPWKKPTHL